MTTFQSCVNIRIRTIAFLFALLPLVLSVVRLAERGVKRRESIIDTGKGQKVLLNSNNFDDSYLRSYDSLKMTFSENRMNDAGNASYTCNLSSGSTVFFGKNTGFLRGKYWIR
jgi:hypothetical protein